MKKILLILITLSVAIGVVAYWFFSEFHSGESKRRKITSIDFTAIDPDGNLIGFANAVFLDSKGNLVKATTLASKSGGMLGGYTFETASKRVLKSYYVDSDWGKGVASAQIEAFGCEGSGPVKVIENKRGSGWALSHTFHVEYTVTSVIKTRPASNPVGDEAILQQLIQFVKSGPHVTYEREYLYSVALHELQRIGPEAEIALPFLIETFTDNSTEVLRDWPQQNDLIATLVAVGRNSNETIPTLRAILTNRELSSYYPRIISALGKMGPNTKGVMPALIASLAYDKEHDALSFFSEWGGQASAAVPAIIDVLKTSNDPVSLRGALYTLRMIGTEEALRGYEQFKIRPEIVSHQK